MPQLERYEDEDEKDEVIGQTVSIQPFKPLVWLVFVSEM